MPTGQKLLDSLAETWDFFFSDVLPTLQAIFYPVQVGVSWLGAWDEGDPETGWMAPAPMTPSVLTQAVPYRPAELGWPGTPGAWKAWRADAHWQRSALHGRGSPAR